MPPGTCSAFPGHRKLKGPQHGTVGPYWTCITAYLEAAGGPRELMATHKNKELEAPKEVGAPREMEAPKREVKALREIKDPHMIGQTIIHIWPIKEEKNR